MKWEGGRSAVPFTPSVFEAQRYAAVGVSGYGQLEHVKSACESSWPLALLYVPLMVRDIGRGHSPTRRSLGD
jgi:hypothetical protein